MAISSKAIDLQACVIGLYRDGKASLVSSHSGPPPEIDGYSIGAPFMTHEPPHGGEMHPDGDEVLVLLSGSVTILLEDRDPPREVQLAPGQAFIVPGGIWHRVVLSEPSQLLYITPGPGSQHRPPGTSAGRGG